MERGIVAPEELAALAVVVACYAHRNSLDRDQRGGRDRARGAAGGGVGSAAGHRRTFRPDAGCWANCWACR
ncbi:acyl-CoA carboxylase subunit epsilon [Streptomyces sp. NBC_01233]|uniref:acyl-CoA carboxylase subunit epsilon n=1 Tax=Streptomyces sp. NBC_01233 TaxID=2903787 RepID=UPI002E135AFA|nr:acyl-CoA carboxylase subunit epsilon [Streptomyces sp. NBC_01233]